MANVDWDFDSKEQDSAPEQADLLEETQVVEVIPATAQPAPAAAEAVPPGMADKLVTMMSTMLTTMKDLSGEIRTMRNNDALSLTSLKRMEGNVNHAAEVSTRNTWVLGVVMLGFTVFTALAYWQLSKAKPGTVDEQELVLTIKAQNELLTNKLSDALLHNGEAIVDSVSTINELEKADTAHLIDHVDGKFNELAGKLDALKPTGGKCHTYRHKHRSRPYWHSHTVCR